MQYFEDFEHVAGLKIVDSYFERIIDKVSGEEKNTLYLVVRTLAQPYQYYCRSIIFDEKNEKILYCLGKDRGLYPDSFTYLDFCYLKSNV